MIKDQHGVVFDVAEEKKPLFEEYIRRQQSAEGAPEKGYTVEIATELPDVLEEGQMVVV